MVASRKLRVHENGFQLGRLVLHDQTVKGSGNWRLLGSCSDFSITDMTKETVQAVRGGSPGGRSETKGGRICERGRF